MGLRDIFRRMPLGILRPAQYIEIPSISKMMGIELEFFLVDQEGKVANRADDLISALKSKFSDLAIKPECSQAMIEVSSFPRLTSRNIFEDFFTSFEHLAYAAENMGLGLFPFGCYPGMNTGEPRDLPRYTVQQKILGRENF